MKRTINWARTATILPTVGLKDLHKLQRAVKKELHRRHLSTQADRAAIEAERARVAGGYQAMANFMAGVTWAMSCRAALRASKGHEPIFGKRPQSGEMWLPREILACVRHQVKQRGWHPIIVETAGRVIHELRVLQTSKEARGWNGERLGEAGDDALPEFRMDSFIVKKAAPVYAATWFSAHHEDDYCP